LAGAEGLAGVEGAGSLVGWTPDPDPEPVLELADDKLLDDELVAALVVAAVLALSAASSLTTLGSGANGLRAAPWRCSAAPLVVSATALLVVGWLTAMPPAAADSAGVEPVAGVELLEPPPNAT